MVPSSPNTAWNLGFKYLTRYQSSFLICFSQSAVTITCMEPVFLYPGPCKYIIYSTGLSLWLFSVVYLQVVRTVWIELKAQVSAHDELDMATTRLRLRLPDEPVPDPPQPHILEPAEVTNLLFSLAIIFATICG